MNNIYVDIDALFNLKGDINRASRSLIDVGISVDSYLQETLERLQKTIDFFQEKLDMAQREVDKAKDNLYKAESAYDSCLMSQREKKDEDGHVYYVPSCSFQAANVKVCQLAVQQAERVRDAWKQKVDAAVRIKNDCEREIDRYNDPGGLAHPCGGRHIILNLAQDHTDKATTELKETIDKVQDILSFSFNTGVSDASSQSGTFDGTTSDVASNGSRDYVRQKFEDGKRKVEELMEEQKSNTVQRNIYEICPFCRKFKYINCICGRGQHERER